MERVRQLPDGALELRQLDPLEVDVLLRVPELLESDDPRVRDRLMPSAYDDPHEEKQWRELVGPELQHLFASHVETVRGDLAGLVVEPGGHGYRLTIPAKHRSAWEAAMTGASHVLYLLAELEPEDAASDPGDLGDPDGDLALFRIRVLGGLLSEILDVEGYL